MTAMLWVGGAGALLALAYWLFIIGEGAYLGSAAVRLVYTRGARFYDDVKRPFCRDDEHLLLPILNAALAGHACPTVLDVATGTGRVPLLLAAQTAFAGSLVGIDLTPAMLVRARAKQHTAAPQATIAWCEGEAGALPWPNASFDLVTCLEALEYFPRPRQALAEMSRVLRPGGALVFSKWPDGWARVLPGKALTRAALSTVLTRIGMRGVEVSCWQPGHYELVVAWKA